MLFNMGLYLNFPLSSLPINALLSARSTTLHAARTGLAVGHR